MKFNKGTIYILKQWSYMEELEGALLEHVSESEIGIHTFNIVSDHKNTPLDESGATIKALYVHPYSMKHDNMIIEEYKPHIENINKNYEI